MATYVVGDIHGCFESVRALLAEFRYQPRRDRLWLVGDLVNRGPFSLEVLRWARDLGDRAVVVLGNHDLHLLARAAGVSEARAKDTLDPVLGAGDAPELLAWLRARPLFHREGRWVMVHAGLLPAWTVAQAEAEARTAERALRGRDMKRLLVAVKTPPFPAWSRKLPAFERRRLALSTFTHLRTLGEDGRPCERFAGPPAEAPDGCAPWYERPHHREPGLTVVFGHWAALGLHLAPGLAALDTGCVWGGKLTALRLDDGTLFQVPNQEGMPRR